MIVEDGFEFFGNRSLVTIFSAPNYCGEFDNNGAIMSVDKDLLCSFEIIPSTITMEREKQEELIRQTMSGSPPPPQDDYLVGSMDDLNINDYSSSPFNEKLEDSDDTDNNHNNNHDNFDNNDNNNINGNVNNVNNTNIESIIDKDNNNNNNNNSPNSNNNLPSLDNSNI